MTMTTTETTLTDFQKELFDWTIQQHYHITRGKDTTLEQVIQLLIFIKEFDLLETTELHLIETGKVATKEQKFVFWFRQNYMELKKIFNLAE